MRWVYLVAALMPLATMGCKARDVDILAEVGERVGQKMEGNFGLSPEVLAGRLRGPMEETGLGGRVRLRLVWDRYITDVNIEIGTPSPGVVRLRAVAPDPATRQRILEIARSTTGVEQLIDEITVKEQ